MNSKTLLNFGIRVKDIKFGPRYVFGPANYGFFRRLLCWLELAGLCSKR
jgi:hypothetical protein